MILGGAFIAYLLFVSAYIVARYASWVPALIPALFGTYLMYVGLKKGPVLVIRSARKMYKLRLRDFFKNSKSNDLKIYLSEKLSYKLEVKI